MNALDLAAARGSYQKMRTASWTWQWPGRAGTSGPAPPALTCTSCPSARMTRRAASGGTAGSSWPPWRGVSGGRPTTGAAGWRDVEL